MIPTNEVRKQECKLQGTKQVGKQQRKQVNCNNDCY